MFFVYVIRSSVNGYFYVGLTENIDSRLKKHNEGSTPSTKPYRPWELFFFETCATRLEAREREKYLKSGIGKEFIKRKWAGIQSAD